MPTVRDIKVFVPTQEFDLSLRFYKRLGWKCNWRDESGLAEIELANVRLYLQNYYVKEWAENFMIYLDVDDAAAWHTLAREALQSGEFPRARTKPPAEEPYGALVTYIWDPSGVLLHCAQKIKL